VAHRVLVRRYKQVEDVGESVVGRMRWLARFATRQPGWVLALWAVAFAVALAAGPSARRHLHETDLQIPGTDSARAAQLTSREFGGTVAIAILLKGPPQLVETRGPQIVAALERIPRVDVLSPWAVGGARVLQEPSGEALLTLQVRRPFQQISDKTTPAVQRVLRRFAPAQRCGPPAQQRTLCAEITGQAPLVRALNQASLRSLDKGELIALPILVVLLLAIFRSPLAALVPALSGLLVTRIGTALMGVIAQHVEIDALALNMVTMIGLALGVDYSLLIVSRFREELAAGRTVPAAIEEVTARAGRTVVFAGTALSAGMLGALVIAPGALLVSATLGVIVATVMAVIVALFAMPAGLALAGTRIDAWRFGPTQMANPWVGIADRALRRPGAAAFFTLLPLVLLSGPAAALNTGPPNVANLPPNDAARKSYEDFQRDRGAGWSAPFEVVFQTDGPLTSTARLRALQRFQERVSRTPGVDAVLGPADVLQRTALLRRLTRQALASSSPLGRLERGLRRADAGTAELAGGLSSGATGADQLVAGLEQAGGGSGQLASALRDATPQTGRLARGVAQAHQGSARITRALRGGSRGSTKLLRNIEVLEQSLNDQSRTANDQLSNPLDDAQTNVQTALRELGSTSPAISNDPHVARARQAVSNALLQLGTVALNLSNFTTTLDANAIAARQILAGTKRLRRAVTQLSTGSGHLSDGLAQARRGAAELSVGMKRLSRGASALDAGLAALLDGTGGNGGARALAAGLQTAVGATQQLGGGVQTILSNVVAVRQGTDRQQQRLRHSGTNVAAAVDSGYFVLAALGGAPRQARTNLSFAMNAAGGGSVARVIVVGTKGPFDRSSHALRRALEREAAATGRELHARAALVAGPAVLLDDFNRATSARFPWLVLTLVLVTFLVLLLAFRSPVLALCAVVLNLVTVGAAVGVLVICFQGGAPLLGGPGYLDAIALSGIFAIIFGLSIDYEVFLISRLVEGRALTGTTEGAIRYGLEKTATIITGAAFIMAGVFLAFAVSPVANTRQFGIGLTVAVLLDATVVRLILLPALIRLFGERTWYVPRWLQRRAVRPTR
jgi:putative drug exporter of the RND superfamily